MTYPKPTLSSRDTEPQRTVDAGTRVVVRIPIEVRFGDGDRTLEIGAEGKIVEVGGSWYVADFEDYTVHLTAEDAESLAFSAA